MNGANMNGTIAATGTGIELAAVGPTSDRRFHPTTQETMKLRNFKIAATAAALALGTIGSAQAAGCMKGAVVGGVAGHYAGHHAVVGAVGGCIVGHHLAKQHAQEQAMQRQAAANDAHMARTAQ